MKTGRARWRKNKPVSSVPHLRNQPLCWLAIAMSACCLPAPCLANEETLAKQYAKASTGAQRLRICMAAMEEKVIDYGMDVKVIKKLFGSDFGKDFGTRRDNGVRYGMVYFDRRVPPKKRRDGVIEQYAITGWYLVVEYGKGGKSEWIEKCYLSNIHK